MSVRVHQRNGKANRVMVDKATKQDFYDFLGEKGIYLYKYIEDRGEWNQRTVYEVYPQYEPWGSCVIDSVIKGDRPDWDYMISEVKRLFP